MNALPLYIGKSRNLRERVGAHFSSDYRCSTDARLSAEIRRIEFEETAGEIGALLRESALVKSLLPAHNHALRRKAESGVLEIDGEPGAAALHSRRRPSRRATWPDTMGRSRRSARRASRCATSPREHALCWSVLGLEQRAGPCFARQVRRCAGACVGAEIDGGAPRTIREALAPLAVPPWPYRGLAAIRERAFFGERTDVHVLRDWCWLGTARDEGELGAMMDAPPRPVFDADIAKLLIRTLARGRHDVLRLE